MAFGGRAACRTLLVACGCCLVQAGTADDAAAAMPNVVYMLADDVGWGDIACHGGSTPTPTIDALFASGVELTQCMSWCVCSPTRAMLLTGRHPFRVGTGPRVGGELPASETTIAEVFRAAGYRTGVFGKWHSGDEPDTPEYRAAFAEAWKSFPNRRPRFGLGVNAHGFDEAWVFYGGGGDYFTRRNLRNLGPVSWWHNLQLRSDDPGYTEDLVVDRACEFLRQSGGRPFFCYVPFHLVHEPMQAKESDLAAVDSAVADPTKRTYAAMVKALDANVARILATLDDLGLRENTIVVFTSDNGATRNGNNLPLRGKKHTLYDGGVRMPTVIHWPAGGIAGRPWHGLCSSLDMLPTLAAFAGIDSATTQPLDGRSLAVAIHDATASPVESVYWSWQGTDAIRTPRWKLHRFFSRVELFDMQADPAEAGDVAAAHADVVAKLTAKMDAWAESLAAALSHRPPQIDGTPAPSGDVLEITVTVPEGAKPSDRLIVPFAMLAGDFQATDHLEFDVMVPQGSLASGFFISPVENMYDGPHPAFRKGDGIDQFGREQAAGPAPRGGAGIWEHRVVGLCSYAPGFDLRQACVFTAARAGTFTIHVDNLRIRHADGSTAPIWTDSPHTQFRPMPAGPSFTDLRVRTVAALTERGRAAQPASREPP